MSDSFVCCCYSWDDGSSDWQKLSSSGRKPRAEMIEWCYHRKWFFIISIAIRELSISETQTLDYLFIQTLCVCRTLKWPHRTIVALRQSRNKWRELIELQWRRCAGTDVRMCCTNALTSLYWLRLLISAALLLSIIVIISDAVAVAIVKWMSLRCF